MKGVNLNPFACLRVQYKRIWLRWMMITCWYLWMFGLVCVLAKTYSNLCRGKLLLVTLVEGSVGQRYPEDCASSLSNNHGSFNVKHKRSSCSSTRTEANHSLDTV